MVVVGVWERKIKYGVTRHQVRLRARGVAASLLYLQNVSCTSRQSEWRYWQCLERPGRWREEEGGGRRREEGRIGRRRRCLLNW